LICVENFYEKISNLVSPLAHKGGNIDFLDLHWEHRKYKPWKAYGDSKIVNFYFIFGLPNRLAAEGFHVLTATWCPILYFAGYPAYLH
jgi:hypothetical protein